MERGPRRESHHIGGVKSEKKQDGGREAEKDKRGHLLGDPLGGLLLSVIVAKSPGKRGSKEDD